MRVSYRNVPTEELRKAWKEKRDALKAVPPLERDWGEIETLIAMRDELDKRETLNSGQQVEFTDYVTD